jgi:hypothetical protein
VEKADFEKMQPVPAMERVHKANMKLSLQFVSGHQR